MQAKADITGRSFLISHMLQATALGAAAIAGGSRMKRNMDADSEKETISPTDALREAYDIKYETYRDACVHANRKLYLEIFSNKR